MGDRLYLCQRCQLGPETIKSTGERQLTTNRVRMIRKKTKMPCFLMNHSEICVHFLIYPPIQKNSHKHYTFLMQTCQNCVHMQLSTISKCYTLLYKHVKIADYTFSYLVSTISNTTLFLYKHVKIASINKMSTISNTTLCCTFPYKLSTITNDYTFATQTCQNCVHTQMSTISITTLLYTKLPKLRP